MSKIKIRLSADNITWTNYDTDEVEKIMLRHSDDKDISVWFKDGRGFDLIDEPGGCWTGNSIGWINRATLPGKYSEAELAQFLQRVLVLVNGNTISEEKAKQLATYLDADDRYCLGDDCDVYKRDIAGKHIIRSESQSKRGEAYFVEHQARIENEWGTVYFEAILGSNKTGDRFSLTTREKRRAENKYKQFERWLNKKQEEDK